MVSNVSDGFKWGGAEVFSIAVKNCLYILSAKELNINIFSDSDNEVHSDISQYSRYTYYFKLLG